MKKETLILAIMCSVASMAQSDKKLVKIDSLRSQTLNPIVVTGTGTFHRADDSPLAVRVITAKDLHDAQVTNLQEALTKLTTTVTTHTSGMGTFVNFGGVSDDYIVIMENGKRLTGDDRWNRVSMANVKRIEIYSGAASALYGSDAIAGVINVITDDSRQPVSAASETRLRDNGRLDQSIDVDVSAGKFSSQTSYTHQQADNWQVNRYQEFEEGDQKVLKLTGRPMSVGYGSHNVTERMEWRFDDKWSAYLRGSFYDYNTHRPQDATYFTQKKTTDKTTGDATYDYTSKKAYTYDLHHQSYSYGGGARWVPNKKVHVYLDVYSDNYTSYYDYWQTETKEPYDETRKRTHYTNETLRGIFRLAKWNKLTAGAEMVQVSLTSQSDNIDGCHTNTYNIFAQDEVNITKGLEGIAGVRYTQNDNFGAAFTPNVGLFYHIKGFRARFNYAGGYRTPTLSQLYATDQAKTTSRYTINNPDLQPEKNHFLNLSFEYGNHWMQLSVNGFLNKIRDMINYRTMTDAEISADAVLTALQTEGWKTIRQRDNIDRATLRGISASVKFLLPCGFTLGGGYTLTDSEAETQELDKKTQQYVVSKTPVDKSVKHVGSVHASWDKTWSKAWGDYHLNITLNGHQQSRRYSSTYGYADGIGQWDITTRHTVSLRHFTLEPGVGIENLFNQRDTSPWSSNYSTINPGRSFIASLRMTY